MKKSISAILSSLLLGVLMLAVLPLSAAAQPSFPPPGDYHQSGGTLELSVGPLGQFGLYDSQGGVLFGTLAPNGSIVEGSPPAEIGTWELNENGELELTLKDAREPLVFIRYLQYFGIGN
ncbi:MAG: hypothetical protein KDD66_07555 [Bdellovibrionales bacterium]|nr:hypothetical protein [Bdellovibrionales bacterium]